MKILELLKNQNGITVYHGSETQITNFVTDFVGGEGATDQEGPGIYFTTSINNAYRYGQYLHTAILKPRKLLTKSAKGGTYAELLKLAKMAPDWKETAQNWDMNPIKGIDIFVKNAIDYNDNQKDRFLQVWVDFYRNHPKKYVENCVKMGYDGIVVDTNSLFEDEPIKHYIIYNPAIIEKVG
jgi:hypothetical protein